MAPPGDLWERVCRTAVLDLGSNSFHLLVAQLRRHSGFEVIDDRREMVRIGEGAFAAGFIPRRSIHRGLRTLGRLQRIARELGASPIVAVATSAIREARNGPEFIAGAARKLGLPIRILTGSEEAELAYRGASLDVDFAAGRVALLDLGGGSMEIVLGDARAPSYSASLPLGVLRCKDECMKSDPPAPAELDVLRSKVRDTLSPPANRLREQGFDFVGFLGGTARSLRALAESLQWIGSRDGRVELSIGLMQRLEHHLSALGKTQRERWISPIAPGRADTLLPGAIILQTALELLGTDEALVCATGLREGVIDAYANAVQAGAVVYDTAT